jgi:hypothetical protein
MSFPFHTNLFSVSLLNSFTLKSALDHDEKARFQRQESLNPSVEETNGIES